MKVYSKIILTLALSLSPLAAMAGDFVYSPNRSCKVPMASAPITCDNNGYLFGYGGFSFSHGRDVHFPFVKGATSSRGIPPYDGPETERWESDGHSFIYGGGVGVRSAFLGGSRFEIEGLVTRNDYDVYANGAKLDFSAFGYGDLHADVDTKAIMFNLLKEFPLGHCTGYVGGGLGVAMVDVDTKLVNSGDTGVSVYGSDVDMAFAAQIIAGVDVPVTECCSLFFQYKMLSVSSIDISCASAPIFNPSTGTYVNIADKYASFDSYIQHNMVFGARVFF